MLEAQVPVQAAGTVFLDDEARRVLSLARFLAAGSGVASKSRLRSYSPSLLPFFFFFLRAFVAIRIPS
jgi:hypothetical protein